MSQYSARNPYGYRNMSCRTEKYRKSFFPSCILAWNNLKSDWHRSESLSIFKKKVNETFIPPRPPLHYGQGDRKLSIMHTRLRLGHNTLFRHLHRIGVRETPRCSCGFKEESESHYLLHCPLYHVARTSLVGHLRTIIGPSLILSILTHIIKTYIILFFLGIMN